MVYVLGDSLDFTESNKILRNQFCQDLITAHKCTGAQALYNSGKYIDPIFRETQNLRDDPDFTVKELYRRHNFAESNIGRRKAAKIKDGPPILSAASANDATESTHSSLSNTIDVPERAHLDEGIGSFSEANKETTESTHSSSSNTQTFRSVLIWTKVSARFLKY
jgi:hypothetical protein